MNKSNHRSPFAIVGRLIVLVKPMLPVMLAAIVMGVAGHFCATFITIFGGFGILRALGLASPLKTVSTAFACILVFALLRGVLRYAEQASNHYIAFKLLALIRDKQAGGYCLRLCVPFFRRGEFCIRRTACNRRLLYGTVNKTQRRWRRWAIPDR